MPEYKLFFNNCANPALVSKLVGHSDIQTTLQSYTRAITETKDMPLHLLSKIAS